MRLDPERFLVNVAGYTQATSPKARPPRLATIDYDYDPGTFPGVWPRVVFDGETTPTRKRWPVLSGYWPRPGDRVLMQPVGLSSYVIVGTLSQEGASYVGGDLHVSGVAPGRLVFQAFRDQVQSISNNATPQAANAMQWETVPLDVVDGWSTSSPTRFAPQVAGWYRLSGKTGFAASTGGTVRGAAWFINGAAVNAGLNRHVTSGFANTFCTVNAPEISVVLTVGDYVELVAVQNSGGALNTTGTGSGAPYMEVVYAGPP